MLSKSNMFSYLAYSVSALPGKMNPENCTFLLKGSILFYH